MLCHIMLCHTVTFHVSCPEKMLLRVHVTLAESLLSQQSHAPHAAEFADGLDQFLLSLGQNVKHKKINVMLNMYALYSCM